MCVTYSAEDEGAAAGAAGAAGALPESVDELGAGVVPDFPLSVL